MTSPPRRRAPPPRSAARAAISTYFQGDGTTARLAGQWQDYLNKTMTGLPRPARAATIPGMSDLMKATSTDDIAALAQYLAGLQIEQYLDQGR